MTPATSFCGMPPDPVVFGTTRKMQELHDQLDKLAQTNIPVLIHGESGTGKEIIARVIHRKSPRQAGPFVKITCSAIWGTPLEAELFGYERGGLGGDDGARPKLLKRATQGTLFFDEIGDLNKELQAKLLQLLQDGQFSPIDGRELDHVDVRMICATSRNLEDEMNTGDFRTDLFYRINVASIHLPPLRERRADIPILAQYFLDRCTARAGGAVRPISPEILRRFEGLSWRGNIRELENLIQRYVILGAEIAIRDGMSGPIAGRTEPPSSQDGKVSLKSITRQASRELEREIILRVLAENRWNRRKAAKILDISYRALLYKLREAVVAGARIPEKRDRQ